MSAISRWICALFLSASALLVFGQPLSTQETLLVKKWKLAYYEEGGERIPPAPDQRNDMMEFHADHTVVSVESGGTQNGTWVYHEDKKQLVVVDKATKERMELRVVTLEGRSCVLEFKDADGVVLRVHMVPL